MRCEPRLVAAGTTAGFGVALCIATAVWAAGPREWVPYSTFETDLHEHLVKKATVSANEIEATLDNGQVIVATRVPSEIAAELQQYGVEYSGSAGSDTGYWLWIVPMLLLAALLLVPNRFSGSRVESAATSMGKSKARTYVETSTRTTFDDVAGVDEAKEELQEIVAFLRAPRRYGRLGARVPKGVLLVGRRAPARHSSGAP